jgi:hypothetical protein
VLIAGNFPFSFSRFYLLLSLGWIALGSFLEELPIPFT